MLHSKILLISIIAVCLDAAAAVTLTESQTQWKTFNHTMKTDCSLQNDTFSTDIVTHTYKSLVLENELLRVTLVPEFGGRILSMIYKPTGHEELYQNPVGRPYGPQWDAFYYDWLMVWGGIFPTLPEPEHGKGWCRPWAYTVTNNDAEKISVKMTFTDSINFPSHPSQFKYGTTNITCDFEVTLEANSSALRTSVTLTNPNNAATPFEYWTNVSVAPGSSPGSTKCDDQTEIIGPVSKVKILSDWPEIRSVEQNAGTDIYQFDKLRWYKNWPNDGIAYAWPVEGNFWGAVNHSNNEAIVRISENVTTPGLKIWGFGYPQSKGFDPEKNIEYHRPFIELWAGASKQFFTPAQFAAKSTLQFDEYYTPTVGLTKFTHASKYAVIDLATDKTAYNGTNDKNAVVTCRYFVTNPAERVTVSLRFKGSSNTVPVYEETKTPETNGPFDLTDTVAVQDLCSDIDSLVFELRTEGAEHLMHAGVPVTITNAGTCATSVREVNGIFTPTELRTGSGMIRHYTIDGKYISESGTRLAEHSVKTGIIVSVDRQGHCRRIVRLSR